MPSDTVTRLLQLSAQRFKADVKTLKAEDDFFQTLGMNSLDALNLLSALEKEFDVEIPDYELQGIHTFLALAEVIDRRRSC